MSKYKLAINDDKKREHEYICVSICYVIKKQKNAKPVFNDYFWDPKIVFVVDRWLSYKGHFYYQKLKNST